jgi:malate dehydrogenase
MVTALAEGGDELWTASVMLEGEYGLDGVSLSVPVRLAAGGLQEIEEWPLSQSEQAELRAAAQVVSDAVARLG